MPPEPPPNAEDFLHVHWDPRPADTRVALSGRRFVSGIGGLVITLLVWGGLYWWARRSEQEWAGTGQWTVTAVVVGLSVALLVFRLVAWRLAVRHRRQVGEGEVITASWPGLQIAGHYWDWEELGPVRTERGRAGGGDRYVFDTPDGEWTCEVDDLDIRPATLQAALVLYSQRRCGADLAQIAH